jgi:Holliday junction resolvasome RuvABC DNA-binding subunit
LTALGFSRVQAEAAIAKVSRSDVSAPVEQLLRQALATLG